MSDTETILEKEARLAPPDEKAPSDKKPAPEKEPMVSDQMAPEELERQILLQKATFEEMMETKGWRVYQTLLQQQLALRLQILRTPLHDIRKPVGPGQQEVFLDHDTRASYLESVKGAIIGLELARDLPRYTIENGKQLLKERAKAAGVNEDE